MNITYRGRVYQVETEAELLALIAWLHVHPKAA